MHKLPSEAPLAKRFRMSSLRPMGCSIAVQRDRKSAVAMPCMRTSDIGNGAYRLASDTDSTERVVEGDLSRRRRRAIQSVRYPVQVWILRTHQRVPQCTRRGRVLDRLGNVCSARCRGEETLLRWRAAARSAADHTRGVDSCATAGLTTAEPVR